MLLAGSLPSGQDVGGIILRDLARLYPPGRLCCFALADAGGAATTPDPDWLPTHVESQPFDSGADWHAGITSRLAAHLQYRRSRDTRMPALTRRACEFARTNDASVVWAVLSHPLLYAMAHAVAEQLGVPLVATVWDPPESVALNLRLDRLSRRMANSDFEAAMRRTTRVAAISEAMAEEYAARYGVQAIVLRHGVDPTHRRPVARRPNDDGFLTIGFSGSLYATKEWRALLAALGSVGWRIEDRGVRVRALTPAMPGVLNGPGHIEWLGWRPTGEAVRLLAESDVNYLPYWFDPSRREAVRLCFPTKLTSYLASGRPVFFHGPQDSSPPRFFERFPVATCCHTLAAEDILDSLRRVVADTEFYGQAAAAIDAAIDEELNASVLRRRFAELLGVDPHILTPAPETESARVLT